METTFSFRNRLAIFAWLWAFSVVLHLLYLANSYAAFSAFTADHVVHLALAVLAIALMLRPRSLALLATVCALTPITAWYEAPRLGNHWLLASLVALGLLCSMALGVAARPRDVFGRLINDGLPSARLIFLVAYGFCALAKFNTSFIDPSASCANVFLNEVVRSFGISQFNSVGTSAWMHAVPWIVLLIESSVVVLLLIARTRVLGVIIALCFHGVIAFDTAHAFSDFSSVIAALGLLFLPDAFFDRIGSFLSSFAVRMFTVVLAVVSAVLIVWQSTDSSYRWVNAIGDVRDWSWWLVWAALTAFVLTWSVRTRTMRSDVALLPEHRSMILWPALAFLIGCGPYLGFRTATSWNMYANLRTAKNSSNSFVIPAALQLVDEQSDLVRIIATTDPDLAAYIDSNYELPYVNLRDITSTNPDSSITFVRNGVTTTVEHTREDPELGEPISWWDQKVVGFRSISTTELAACQNTMLPAR